MDAQDRSPDEVPVALVDVREDLAGALGVLQAAGVFDALASAVHEVLPDPATWRLTVSGDFAATINRHDERGAGEEYATARGAGRAGARTKRARDGIFDIVIDLDSFLTSEATDPKAFLAHARAAAAHLGTHEAGHALLAIRGEEAAAYQDAATGAPSERAWRKHLALHLDDFRIERMTRGAAPNPTSQVPGLPDAIGHLRGELTASAVMIGSDIGAATMRAMEALNYLVRVIAYTTAELGVAHGGGVPPEPVPEGWPRYLEESWNAWSLVFHEAKPANEPMTVVELGRVLTTLCRLVVAWCDSVGFEWRMDDRGAQTAYWTTSSY